MRILRNPDAAHPPSTTAGPAPAPAPNVNRLEALENIVKAALQRLQGLEERIDALGEAPKGMAPAGTPEPPAVRSSSTLSETETEALSTDALKKGLLSKMWKYMNDERSSKAA